MIHLYIGKEATEFPFPDIFFNLMKTIHVGVGFIFKLDMYHRDAVYKQCDIKPSVPALRILFGDKGPVLVYHLIDAASAGHTLIVQHHKVEGLVPPLYVYIDFAIFPHEPLSSIIKGLVRYIVFHLGKLTFA